MEKFDVLDARQGILQGRRYRRLLEVHGQDMTLALAEQHDFLGHIVRSRRRCRHDQQQHLGVIERIDDFLAPQCCPVDAALVDPQAHAGRTEFARQIEDAILVLARVADKNVCRLRQLGPSQVTSKPVRLAYCAI